MEPSVTSVLLRLGAVLALVAADGMFGAAEFAIVSVRRTRLIPLIERGSKRARRVLRAAEKPDAFIAATQLGITMASLGLGWIGEPPGARVAPGPGAPNDAAVQDAVTVVREAGFSRIPVFAEDLDHIVGMVHAKDLLVAQAEGRGPEPGGRVMRPVLYVPGAKPGGDLLEELVGEIPGEFRPERRLVVLQQADRIIVDAAIPLDDLNERFRIALPTTEANTLGGVLFPPPGTTPGAGGTL